MPGKRHAGLEQRLFDGNATRQFVIEGVGEGAGIVVIDAEAHAEGVGDFLPRQSRGQVAELRFARFGGDAGVERDQEDAVAHAPHKLLGSYRIKRAVLLLKAEEGSHLLVLPAVSHEMYDAQALARDQAAQLLDGRRARSLKRDGIGNLPEQPLSAAATRHRC